VLPSPKIEQMPQRDHQFARNVSGEVKNLNRCYQCSMCSDGCPVAYAMDYYPNEIIYMAHLGLKEKVLQSKAIWLCLSCNTCATRCPNEIDIVRLMDVLRGQSLREGIKSPVSKIPQFHKAFVEGIRKRGRVDTVELILNYELKTLDVFSSLKKFREQTSYALEMFRKGKLKLPFRKKHGQKRTEELFKNVLSSGKIREGV